MPAQVRTVWTRGGQATGWAWRERGCHGGGGQSARRCDQTRTPVWPRTAAALHSAAGDVAGGGFGSGGSLTRQSLLSISLQEHLHDDRPCAVFLPGLCAGAPLEKQGGGGQHAPRMLLLPAAAVTCAGLKRPALRETPGGPQVTTTCPCPPLPLPLSPPHAPQLEPRLAQLPLRAPGRERGAARPPRADDPERVLPREQGGARRKQGPASLARRMHIWGEGRSAQLKASGREQGGHAPPWSGFATGAGRCRALAAASLVCHAAHTQQHYSLRPSLSSSPPSLPHPTQQKRVCPRGATCPFAHSMTEYFL